MRPSRRQLAGRSRPIAALGLLLALAFAACGGSGGDERPFVAAPADRPNIVFLLTDDQEYDAMSVMHRTRRLLGREGVTFENAFTSYPLCCPSRATFLTGQHAHNHGVIDNRAPEGGYTRLDNSETLPVWLRRAGYLTAHFGKYLNDYMRENGVPPGWHRWFGMAEPAARYFKATFVDDGEVVSTGKRPADYSTDLMTDKAIEFIRSDEARSAPFYLSIGYVAPHVGKSFVKGDHCTDKGPEPAPRHLGRFRGREIPRTPNFNEDDVSDKPSFIRETDKVLGKTLREKTDKYQCRLETLLAVDESVARIVRALREVGELDNTYIFFISDNGFVQGQHRLKGGKAVPYEDSIRVPMLVRGPGVARGAVTRELVANVDFAPTMLDIAGGESPLNMDGESLLPVLSEPGRLTGRAIPLESFREDGFHGVRTDRFAYAERTATGEVELYDLRLDPYQLESVHDDPQYERAREALAELNERLADCSGKGCVPKPRLELEITRKPAGDGADECESNRAVVAVVGEDADVVTEVRGEVGGRRLVAAGPAPRVVRVPPHARPRVRVRAELVDGRLVDLAARAPGCLSG
jgi:arylsulfatase A-like enzyme